MSKIAEQIFKINTQKEKVLSVFLTAGYPDKDTFVELAIDSIDAGADLLEIGIPFSDPLADGPVIQSSSQYALRNGIALKDILQYISKIKSKKSTPLILMGYANPILKYGIDNFFQDAINSGADGLIVPDVPLEEYSSFYCDTQLLDVILLVTPTSSVDRINQIDQLSKGFVYCISINGTTGIHKHFSEDTIHSIKKAYSTIKKNKMLLGFGISGEETVKQVKDYCDGVIVGSAVIKSLKENGIDNTLKFINTLKQVLKQR